MVPTQGFNKYVLDVNKAGLTVDITHTFNDLIGGQSKTGEVQTLVIRGSVGKDLNAVIVPITQVSSTLPYR